jgi:transcriptional regulator with XRE-family HTH domain
VGVDRERDLDRSLLVLFAEELKAARSRAGLSQDQLGDKIGYSASLVAKIETCRGAPSMDFAKRCDDALETGGTLGRMHKFVGRVPFPSWFRPFVDYEAAATSLRLFEHVLVPGLLQTEEYARAVLATRPNTTEEETDQLVSARLERQEVLAREDPPLLWVVLDEGVLHRQVGEDGQVMHGQLLHLAEMSRRPNITVGIVPYSAGAHGGLLGAFAVAEFKDAPAIVYLETAAEGQVSEEPSMVAQVMLTFDTLRSEGLPRGASRDLIMKVAEERWT